MAGKPTTTCGSSSNRCPSRAVFDGGGDIGFAIRDDALRRGLV